MNNTRRISLQNILIFFLCFTNLGDSSLVGYLSFRNGEKVVNQLANQLESEITNPIQEHHDNYLEYPYIVAQINIDPFSLNNLIPVIRILWQFTS